MSEAEVVSRTPFVRTLASLRQDLERLNLPRQVPLLVHSSLSALGWVNGGAEAVIHALIAAVGPDATLAMPAHSGNWSDPAQWQNPPVPSRWWETIRSTMPIYDPRVTPTRGMGRIAELFRTWPGVVRSLHPAFSFSALGPLAETLTAHHSIEFGLGPNSPLGRMYELDGEVLLLGAGFQSCTSFHLAEYRIPNARIVEERRPMIEGGRLVWVVQRDVEMNEGLFADLGTAFESTGAVKAGAVGSATARLFPIRAAVDFAVEWLAKRAASGPLLGT